MHWLDLEEPNIERPSRLGRLRDLLRARKRAIIGAAIAAASAVGLFVALAPRQYSAEAQIFIASPVNLAGPEAAERFPGLSAEARLIASPELGRRAVEELGVSSRAEFDAAAEGVDLIARALVFLRLARAPAEAGKDVRDLQSFEDRLSVSAPEHERLVKIAFRSRDRAFAAAAANLIAALYLEMRADAEPAGDHAASASVISAAVAPARPAFPSEGLLFAIGATAAIFTALALGAFRRTPQRLESDEPMAPPHAVGDSSVFVRLRDVPKHFAQARQNAALRRAEADNVRALDDIALRILSARRPASGLRIVGAKLSRNPEAPDISLPLARLLSREGRAIFIGLDHEAEGADQLPVYCGGRDLSDLISGCASFAEVIRRDPRSRLHFAPAAVSGSFEVSELASVIDALARTYDFIFLTAPALDGSDMARALAVNADFVLVRAPPEPRNAAIAKAEVELRACGAREVIVVGAPTPLRQSIGKDAA